MKFIFVSFVLSEFLTFGFGDPSSSAHDAIELVSDKLCRLVLVISGVVYGVVAYQFHSIVDKKGWHILKRGCCSGSQQHAFSGVAGLGFAHKY